jgi:hypothetical protein
MSQSKMLWVEEALAPEMNGKCYENIWMSMIGNEYVVCMDYYMVENGIVFMVNDGTKQASGDSLENTKNECICIGDYDPNRVYVRDIKYYSKEEIKKRLFV